MVVIEFMNFDACVVSPVEPKNIVKQMLAGPIKIDCNCEDWRYRLRYIATKGKYAAGPWFESGFPKITNPLLHGVGCKHVLRVATLINASPTFKITQSTCLPRRETPSSASWRILTSRT